MPSHRLSAPLAFVAVSLVAVPAARADLMQYVKKADPSFVWKLKKKDTVPSGTLYYLDLTSQTWQGIKWDHVLQVYLPKDVKPTATMVLYNQGGKPNPGSTNFCVTLAAKARAPVAFLYGIPNQPLLGKKVEDALIAETFVRYLKTGDANWPLLFPMVKSLMRAMDALQVFARQEWKQEVAKFVVTGASKRGWTSWLTAAADPRVKAVAPLVIDTLKMDKQMPHQLKSFGKYSDMIKDYTNTGLVPMPKTPEAKALWKMVDPWAFREKLTMPKMIINGTNDPYWAQDALNLYWKDLQGDKWVLYVPNAGHNLAQKKPGSKAEDHTRVLNTMAAFARHEITDNPMPRLSWKHDQADGKYRLTVQCKPAPKEARVWVADSPSRDFRKATWTEQPLKVEEGTVTAAVTAPKEGFRTFFIECTYEMDEMAYFLSTQLRMIGKAGKSSRE
jgi:PhoPQ-activated pathogenicity-related protein